MKPFKSRHKQRGYAAIPYIASFFTAGAAGGAATTAVAATAGTTASAAGVAAAGAAGLATYGALASKLLAPKAPDLAMQPPTAGAMVDQAQSAARARQRQQDAIAGGLGATITAPVSQSSFNSSTSGQKTLLGN